VKKFFWWWSEEVINRENLEQIERNNLKPYACFSKDAKRKISIQEHNYRTSFQRDRDRILHSKAFRRLEYKTQVYLTQIGDHLRTRLTHSYEVSQLARTVANQVGLNCDLVETIALGHDLGHAPFGHAGEEALKEILEEFGSETFKHNLQSIRIVDKLERKYSYDGLNLTLPVREGILKHTSLPEIIPDYCEELYIDKKFSITLEGQLVAIIDEIAQVTHDLDDYLRFNIIKYEEIMEHPIFNSNKEFFYKTYSKSFDEYFREFEDPRRKKDLTVRCLVDFLMSELIKQLSQKLHDCKEEAYHLDEIVIQYEDEFHEMLEDFDKYLKNILLSDYKIIEMDRRGKEIIKTLFRCYLCHHELLPKGTREKYEDAEGEEKYIILADFISGMTDRFALEQYDKIISGAE